MAVIVTRTSPVQVAVLAADGAPTAVGVNVRCSAGSATASHVFEAVSATSAAIRPALNCPAGSLIGLDVFAPQEEGKAVLVISSNSGVATRELTVVKAPPPEVVAPTKLDLRLESLRGVGDDGKVVMTESAFVVPAAPITAIAAGTAGEGTVTLRGDQERPSQPAPTMSDLVETPYVLVGSEDEILHQLRANRDRWGITRYTVRTEALDALAPIIDRLRLEAGAR